jgi:hypothetical protein
MPGPNIPNPSDRENDGDSGKKGSKRRISLKKLPGTEPEKSAGDSGRNPASGQKWKLQRQQPHLPPQQAIPEKPAPAPEIPAPPESDPPPPVVAEKKAVLAAAETGTKSPATEKQAVENEMPVSGNPAAQPKARHLVIPRREKDDSGKTAARGRPAKSGKSKPKRTGKATGKGRKWITVTLATAALALLVLTSFGLLQVLFPGSEPASSTTVAVQEASRQAETALDPKPAAPENAELSLADLSPDTPEAAVKAIRAKTLRLSSEDNGVFINKIFYPEGALVEPRHGIRIQSLQPGSGGAELTLVDKDQREYIIRIR